MEPHDLVAHSQTDAAAPGLGGALVEFLLHIGQFCRRNAGTVIPDPDHLIGSLSGQRGIDAPACAAVLGGVVQYVAKHLLQPLRVTADGRQDLLSRFVAQFDPLLSEQLPVGKNGVLKLCLKIHFFQLQRKAAILHLGKFQQLLHHGREPSGLVEDDPQAPVELDLIPLPVCQQRFAPAADGCERRSQLMGHRRDKFRFHFLVLADLHGHIVDIIHQLAQLAGILVFQREAVASLRDPLGSVRYHRHRLHHIVDENQV